MNISLGVDGVVIDFLSSNIKYYFFYLNHKKMKIDEGIESKLR
jgi:hypothetical protein